MNLERLENTVMGACITTYFLNVGYGEAMVVIAEGFCIVIDGGSGRPEVYAQPGTVRIVDFLQRLGIKHIDIMIMTHVHDDHVGGLVEVARRLPIGQIWCNIDPGCLDMRRISRYRAAVAGDGSGELFMAALEAFDKVAGLARQAATPIKAMDMDCTAVTLGRLILTPLGMRSNQRHQVQDEISGLAQAADAEEFRQRLGRNDQECNQTSLAIHLAWRGRGLLLSGDKTTGWEKVAAGHRLKADVLKLTHHGQRNGMPEAMLQAADPQMMVVCADRARTYDSANPKLLGQARAYLLAKGLAPLVYVTGDLQTADGRPAGVLKVELPAESDIIRTAVLSD